LQYFKGTDAYRDLKGVHLHVLDPGGKGIFDDRGFHRGKTEPVVEMVHSSSCRIFITTAMRKTLEECYMTINDLRALWLAFLKMDRKNRGFITLNHLLEYLSETTYSVLAPFIERFFDLIDRAHLDRCTFDEFFPAVCSYALFTR